MQQSILIGSLDLSEVFGEWLYFSRLGPKFQDKDQWGRRNLDVCVCVCIRIWPTLPWQLQDQALPDPGMAGYLQTQALAWVVTAGPLMRLTWKPGGKGYLRSGSPSQNFSQQQRSLAVLC